MEFFIIGAGMGTQASLTDEARRAILTADAVVATRRLKEGLGALRADITACPFAALAETARAAAGRVAVLVSGDVGFFSAATALQAALAPFGEVSLLCGVSSLAYFCARIGISYENARCVSLHGRTGSLVGAVSYNRRVFALTGGAHTATDLCQELTRAGLGEVSAALGEKLGAADERILRGTVRELSRETVSDLAVLFLENPHAVDAYAPIADAIFTRGDTPMTKQEVRWVSLAKLAPRPGDTVWDVGAGTGSVSIELAYRACDGTVYAVERNDRARELLGENRARLGAYNLCVIAGNAPEALADLPAPDCVFIGGSGGKLREILTLVREKNPAARVVVNAIALETLHEATESLHALGFGQLEVVQLAAARGKTVGAYTMMTANNPVFIISGGGAK